MRLFSFKPTSPTDVANICTMRSCGTATMLWPLISMMRWPTRTPPRSPIPPRSRLQIFKKTKLKERHFRFCLESCEKDKLINTDKLVKVDQSRLQSQMIQRQQLYISLKHKWHSPHHTNWILCTNHSLQLYVLITPCTNNSLH